MYTINLIIEYEEVDYSANNQYGIGYNCFSTNHHFTAETETLADKIAQYLENLKPQELLQFLEYHGHETLNQEDYNLIDVEIWTEKTEVNFYEGQNFKDITN